MGLFAQTRMRRFTQLARAEATEARKLCAFFGVTHARRWVYAEKEDTNRVRNPRTQYRHSGLRHRRILRGHYARDFSAGARRPDDPIPVLVPIAPGQEDPYRTRWEQVVRLDAS